jgi:hypothetical protein
VLIVLLWLADIAWETVKCPTQIKGVDHDQTDLLGLQRYHAHDPEVIEAMRPFLETEFGNPSSSHWYGIKPYLVPSDTDYLVG